ncbi:MAG TPA: SUMF1/EgtB/PvdO family nonheme iron enzyme, partial [Rhodanobacteraceae bacterium]|nr:SUMF1/EgtB/PvdO family nonheme iron enzyme [Rhodanobacteraceae bacterium]
VVFELLTGKHPFDKQSAEVAFKEGRKPPKVPGLTKRQYKTLCDAVAFHSEQRLHSAIELIEGLRDVSWRERARPFLVYGVVALVALAAGTWGVSRYMKSHHLDQVVARFSPDNRHRYYNEDQAFQALQSLGDDESKRVVVDHSNAIEQFLLGRLNAYWDPAKKHYDYAGVQHVFQVRDQLKLFSPQLDIKRSAIDQQRNALLNTLDTQLSERIAADAIFENQPDNVVSTLDTIRAIDPHSELLDNAELELKYDIAIEHSLAAGRVDEAKQRLALANRLFPDSKRLKQRSAQLLAIEHASTAAARVAVQQDVPHARTALAELIAKPELTPEWQASAAAALRVLQSDHTPATQKLLASLADAIAGQAAGASTPAQIQQSGSAVTLGLQYVPASQPLLAQQARLNSLQQQLQAQLQQESVAAELDSRMESMKRAAAAHDVTKAAASLAQIRTLQPDSKFLAEEGPQLLANAYLGEAESLVNHGQYQRAVDTLDQGLKTLGNRPDLRNARARDAFVVSLAQARKNPPDADGLKRLHSTLATLGKADASGLAALQSDMKVRGALHEGTFADVLDALKPAVANTPATTPVATAPEQSPATATAPTQIASRPHAPTVSAPSVAVPAPGASAAQAAVASSDPCARPDLVGKGRICFDALGAGRGPALVVVAGLNGGKSYAMSRTDITVAEFNRFCQATHQCAGRSGEGGASLPVTDISVANAKAYAAWLTSTSGYTYRLPTDAEWMHAAQADQGWKQSPDSNCIPPSADANSGPGGPISARGRQPNPWGLVNLTGNVWQWVVSGGEVMVRGGSFNSYWSDCTVAAHRSDNGNPQSDVGFRVLRELR